MKISYNALLNALETDLGSYNTGPEQTPRDKQKEVLRSTLLKKLQDNVDKDADRLALEKFIAADIRCGNWELLVENLQDEYLVGTFRDELCRFFDPLADLSIESLFAQGYAGPGASVGARGEDFYTKFFDSTLTCTSNQLYKSFVNSVSRNDLWYDAEIQRLLNGHSDADIVKGSKLSFVPKTEHISRCICVEPSLNMFYQLGLKGVLEARLKHAFSIDMSVQPEYNRKLARIGSNYGCFATIDLESASDTISIKMLREFLPKHIMSWLLSLRSKEVLLPDQSSRVLNMISSMGNGFTFPLETILFTCATAAAYKVCGVDLQVNTMGRIGNFAVFGDDIIVKTECFYAVKRLLNLLGFRVNADKTFHEGPFRESCGADFYFGTDVRGVYIKSLKTLESRFVAINRLNQWSYKNAIPLPSTISYLLSSIGKEGLYYVPLHESDDAGIQVPLRALRRKYPLNGAIAYKCRAPRIRCLRIKLQGETASVSMPNYRILSPRGSKPRAVNASALSLCFLQGSLRDNQVGLRSIQTHYQLSRRSTPHWDYSPQWTISTSVGGLAFGNTDIVMLNLWPIWARGCA